MDLRDLVYHWAATHHLEARQGTRLLAAAGLEAPPPAPAARLPRVLLALGAALIGLGAIFWVAAQWGDLGRTGRFVLLQAAVAVPAIAAIARHRPGPRAALALLAWLAGGALLACFGQTYQTGADTWQLFAAWAGLGLPLALGLRSDLVWAPWTAVAATAIGTWLAAGVGSFGRVDGYTLPRHLAAWTAGALLVALLAAPLRRWSGAGPWAQRVAVTAAVALTASGGLTALFGSEVAMPGYLAALLLTAAVGALLATRAAFDVFGLSAAALALDVLLVGGLARALFSHGGGGLDRLLLLGLLAAGLLAATVALVLRRARAVA